MKCARCGAWSDVLETRGLHRRRECANLHRWWTEEIILMNDTELLTSIDLAKRWKVDVKTLSNWRTQGKGPAYVKLGSGKQTRVLYRQADVLAFEEAGLREPQKEAAE